jgi:hypothetical protein
MKKLKLILLFLVIYSVSGYSQDLLRTAKDTIRCKVFEIGLNEIKYKPFSNPDGPLIVIQKSDVIEITYENGTKYFNAPDPYNANKEVQIRDKSHAIKFEFFSPLSNKLTFGYETMIKVGTNLEFKAGLIGSGTHKNTDNASGVFIKAGIKFLTTPTYVQNGLQYSHQLKGFYIKPEIIFNTYTADHEFYNSQSTSLFYNYGASIDRVRYTNYGLNIVFGKQYILGNILTLDYYAGAGYGIQSRSYNTNLYSDQNPTVNYAYSHIYGGSDSPLIITGGFTLGVLF